MKTLSPAAKMNAATFTREYRHLALDPDVSLEDLMRPGFWSHHASKLGENDLIDAVATDGSLDVTLRVVKIAAGLVHVRPLRVYQREIPKPVSDTDAADASEEVPDGYVVDHTPRTRWRVRTKDPVVEVSRDHMSRNEAVASAKAHARLAGAVAA